jgi:hypothetical protein
VSGVFPHAAIDPEVFLPVARWKGALIGALATACLFFAPSAWAQSTCDPGLSYSGLVSTNRLGGVHAKLEPLQLPAIQSGWAASWVGVGDPRTVSGIPSRAIRVGLIARSKSEISLVYQVHRSGQPVREREVYRYVKPSERHSVSVVSAKRHANRWIVKVDGRRFARIFMRPGDGWRAFTTVESAVLDAGECNTLAYEVTEPSKAKRRRTRHGIRRDWSALTRAFETSGPLLLQTSTEGFVVSTSDAAPKPSASALAWAPPRLTLPTTITVGAGGGQFDLQPGRDYVVSVGNVSGPVRLVGGRNVVLIGGHITIPWAGDATDYGSEGAFIAARTALYLKGQTGTVHIEGLLIDNQGGDLSEGIQINAPSAVVQIENVRITDIHARDDVGYTDNHPDLIQPWGGVKALRVDHFTGSTDFQGILLKNDGGPTGEVDLRNVNFVGNPGSTWLFNDQLPAGTPINLVNFWLQPTAGHTMSKSVSPNNWSPAPRTATIATDGTVSWMPELGITGVLRQGIPPEGEFVPATLAGTTYASPGYDK